MKLSTAICQVGHPGSLESLVTMLTAVGINCLVPNGELRDHLKKMELDTVVDAKSTAIGWGGDILVKVGQATIRDLDRPDVLYIDIKAHRNGPRLWKHYSHLEKATLWYRINGGRPCIIPGKGDELDPPCPVLTPDPWYNGELPFNKDEARRVLPLGTLDRSYSCWPPFFRIQDHLQHLRAVEVYTRPVSLIHNLNGWGYGEIGEELRKSIDLECYGGYGSPDGLMPYKGIETTLGDALCMVHLKSQDCPGYALYEALASACPVIVTRMLINWCHMEELLIPGRTCFAFEHDQQVVADTTPDPVNAESCIQEIKDCVKLLQNPEWNKKIGEAGRKKLLEVMWTAGKDGPSLADFMERMFG
jgi:hypothetical protein